MTFCIQRVLERPGDVQPQIETLADARAQPEARTRERESALLCGKRIVDRHVCAIEEHERACFGKAPAGPRQRGTAQLGRAADALVAEHLRFEIAAHAVQSAGEELLVADERLAGKLP